MTQVATQLAHFGTQTHLSPSQPKKAVLSIAITKHLTGNSLASVLQSDWTSKATPVQQAAFECQDFDFDPTNEAAELSKLKAVLEGTKWDAVLLGWCVRGHVEFTVLFEAIVDVCVGEVVRRARLEGEVRQDREGNGDGRGSRMKLLFSEGPEDLVRTTLRGFGLSLEVI